MFSFERLSVKQITVFSELVGTSSLLRIDFLKRKHGERAQHFIETVKFLGELGLIVAKGNQIEVRSEYKMFLSEFKTSNQQEQIMREFLIYKLLDDEAFFSKYVKEFISQFHLVGNRYEFTPSTAQRLKVSGLRNFLMDLKFLHLDSTGKKYLVADDYFFVFVEQRESQQLSEDEFQKILKKKAIIGKAAELEVINFEQNRLSKVQLLAEKIEHTAIKDVTAGYDIKSFEEKLDENKKPVPRYIEVKAVSPRNYRFHWTRNEMEKAELYQQKYYLYLLPVRGKKEFDIDALKIIGDPWVQVYGNDNEWIRTEELLAFSLA